MEDGRLCYQVPRADFGAYICGIWKRNLEWRHFGGAFGHVTNTNVLVCVEDVSSSHQHDRQLKWSFGTSTKKTDLRTAYTMKLIPDTDGTFLEWKLGEGSGTGTFRPDVSVCVLQFFMPGSTVTVTYRPMDGDTMAVNIVEVSARGPPTIQFGTMTRLHPGHTMDAGGDVSDG